MKIMSSKISAKDLMGAIVAFNADPSFIETEEQAQAVIEYLTDCHDVQYLTPQSGYDFEVECKCLDLDPAEVKEIIKGIKWNGGTVTICRYCDFG